MKGVTEWFTKIQAMWNEKFDNSNKTNGPRLCCVASAPDMETTRIFLLFRSPQLLCYHEWLREVCQQHSLDFYMMLTLMEMQSGAVRNYQTMKELRFPFPNWCFQRGFKRQWRWLCKSIQESLQQPMLDVNELPFGFILTDDISKLSRAHLLDRLNFHCIYAELTNRYFIDPKPLYDAILDSNFEKAGQLWAWQSGRPRDLRDL